jgi:F0F1-type ATP synthase delta subunit
MVNSKQLAKALIEMVLSDKVSFDVVLDNFEKYLKKNHLTRLLPNIIKSIEGEIERYEKENSLQIISPHQLGKESITKIEEFVEKTAKSKTYLEEDETLIGGFVAKYKGKVYDGSVKNHLKQLKAILMK